MAGLGTEVEWLRGVVNDHQQQWEYCVIWKLGDDPSRVGACCCRGGANRRIDETQQQQQHLIHCKDTFVQHPITTKACTKLAKLPSLIPLYSGIHGDAVISQRPYWIIHTNPDDKGTQVLIPIACRGLIELFSTKEVPKDENFIDYILGLFKVCDKQSMRETNFILGGGGEEEEEDCDPLIPNWLPSLNNLNFHPSSISPPNNYSSFEGSSTCSSLSNDHQMLKIGSHHHVLTTGVSPEENYSSKTNADPRLKKKKNTDSAAAAAAAAVMNHKVGVKGPFKSKNLITERKRRKRISDGMLVLRALVPKITKMDRLGTLGDAADYIRELEASIENYQDELRAIDDDEECSKQDPATLLIKDYSSSHEIKTPIVVEIEVNQIGSKDFLVRLISKERRGGFTRLMEALDSLGLHVTDANITTLNDLVLNHLKVEAKTMDVEVDTLKHSLVGLLIN